MKKKTISEIKESGNMDTPKLDYNDFAPLFGPWAEKFKPFIEGQEMFNIYQSIKRDAQKEVICPDSENVFRAFQKSHPDKIHFFSNRRRHTRLTCDWSSDVCSSDLSVQLELRGFLCQRHEFFLRERGSDQ